jgi:hypothetical protein
MGKRLAALTLVVSAIAASTATAASLDVSSNWSGYTVVGPGSTATTASSSMSFTNVTGTWKQPAVTCTPGQTNSVAIWVGLGGYSPNGSLEQTGTQADCDVNGKATYYTWYELVSAEDVNVNTKLKIFPGDTITASVLVKDHDVLLQVKNRTRRTVITKHLAMAAPDLTSAEWIAEAPSQCSSSGFCRTVALSNFGSVTFTKMAALGNGQGGTLNGPGWIATPIQLVPRARHSFGDADASSSSTAGAAPANATVDGSSFSVGWLANSAAGV